MKPRVNPPTKHNRRTRPRTVDFFPWKENHLKTPTSISLIKSNLNFESKENSELG